MTVLEIALIVLAYLLGSVSAAIITCKLMGLPDPRTEGSKNPGATNVLRIGNKKAAAVTLFGDFLKGLVPVLIGRLLEVEPLVLALIAMAAFLGHLYPVFFGFQGGKGVATALGVILGLSWQVALAALLTWLVAAKVFRISSLSALIAAVLTPLYCWLLTPQREYIIMLALMSLLLIWRHRSNIRKLVSGAEGKIGKN
ncbi:MAG: glycerol-3-phosphate 1-O-acyltransferase PlsY [Gammaproteobacteria bacterium]|nr:glycerol-3-phosphate 1-O-acyltransferase PlsY [Gammaproteobacteria bacterium]MCW8958657.1 glycerol-3-phosphate 1-O-acyltransferase PlsY [Gammaproteobacteria bacterium]MCW8971849.1 glycerol-3-phosphate 1-O-acyltransferase PlsY [Gammaproteobacteria bacterium]MCW8994148.1 glycerol-3-phosphate 1-O-acyltransferase PlsY [Gammaproteobacteria bacterium]